MKLGLLTAPFPDTDLLEVADWTAGAGFEAVEIACWPRASGETRRYAGTSHIDVDGMTVFVSRSGRAGRGMRRVRCLSHAPTSPIRQA